MLPESRCSSWPSLQSSPSQWSPGQTWPRCRPSEDPPPRPGCWRTVSGWETSSAPLLERPLAAISDTNIHNITRLRHMIYIIYITAFKILHNWTINIVRCESWFLSSTTQVVGAGPPCVLLHIGVSSQFVQSLHGPLLDHLLSSLHPQQARTEWDSEREEWEMRGRRESRGASIGGRSPLTSHLSPLTPLTDR